MCADNGVVEEGVTQTGQEVTAIVAENFLEGATSAAIMCQSAEVDLFPIDIGMVRDTRVPNYKVAYGTKNMVKEPAMTKRRGASGNPDRSASCERRKKQDIRYLRPERWESVIQRLGSAVASVLLDESVETMTGRGAGLDSAGLRRKICAIKTAIAKKK